MSHSTRANQLTMMVTEGESDTETEKGRVRERERERREKKKEILVDFKCQTGQRQSLSGFT